MSEEIIKDGDFLYLHMSIPLLNRPTETETFTVMGSKFRISCILDQFNSQYSFYLNLKEIKYGLKCIKRYSADYKMTIGNLLICQGQERIIRKSNFLCACNENKIPSSSTEELLILLRCHLFGNSTSDLPKAVTSNAETQTIGSLNTKSSVDSLSKCLNQMFLMNQKTDVQLVSGENTLNVHSLILCARSEKFCELLAESVIREGFKTLIVENMEKSLFDTFGKFLYTDKLNDHDLNEVQYLYELGVKYGIGSLMNETSNCIIHNFMSAENFLEFFDMAVFCEDKIFQRNIIHYLYVDKIYLNVEKWKAFCDKYPAQANKVYNMICTGVTTA